MRLIDADALYKSFGASGNCSNCPLDWYKCQYYNEHTLMEFCERIDDAPTIDPARYRRWIKMSDADGIFYGCSECGEWSKETSNYCPNCGAKMDGEPKSTWKKLECGGYECTECGEVVESMTRFCPECGSDKRWRKE